eukprot:8892080-Pyramimonas_sp.AAC.1
MVRKEGARRGPPEPGKIERKTGVMFSARWSYGLGQVHSHRAVRRCEISLTTYPTLAQCGAEAHQDCYNGGDDATWTHVIL